MKKLLFMLIPAMMVLFAGCSDSKDDEPVVESIPTSISLNIGDTYKFDLKNETYTSECPLIASINAEGRVTALLEGKTFISLEKRKKKVEVEVKATDFALDLPILAFGETYDYIVSHESREKYMYSTASEYIVWGDTKRCVDNIKYIFTDGKLTGVVLISHYANYDTIMDFLKQRYAVVKDTDTQIDLMSPRGDVYVRVTTTTNKNYAINTYKTQKYVLVSFVGESN